MAIIESTVLDGYLTIGFPVMSLPTLRILEYLNM